MTNKKLNWLCYKCIGDSEIKKRIQEQGKEKKCFYCGELRISIEIRKLATWIDKVYRKYYSSAPYYFVSVCQPAQVEGKNPEEIIAEMVEADKEIANLIVDYLSKEEERRVIKKGESPLYNSSNKYKRIDKSPDELHDMWKLFKKRIQYQRRFFANEAEKLLESILKGIEKFAEKDSLSPVRWLEPNDSK